jgi:hypothetical protein
VSIAKLARLSYLVLRKISEAWRGRRWRRQLIGTGHFMKRVWRRRGAHVGPAQVGDRSAAFVPSGSLLVWSSMAPFLFRSQRSRIIDVVICAADKSFGTCERIYGLTHNYRDRQPGGSHATNVLVRIKVKYQKAPAAARFIDRTF